MEKASVPIEATALRSYIRLIPFLSPEYCCNLIEKAEHSSDWRQALIVNQIGEPAKTQSRKCFFLHGANPLLESVKRACFDRLQELTLSKDSLEVTGFQLVRYTEGEYFEPHRDSIHGYPEGRKLSFVVYLNDDFDGGQTEFLEAQVNVEPVAGNALVFPSSLMHQGKTVTRGRKFVLVFWLTEVPA